MSKPFARLITLLLVPCLTADPFTAHAFSGLRSPRTDQAVFQEEALMSPVVSAARFILKQTTARTAETRMAETLSAPPMRDLMMVPMADTLSVPENSVNLMLNAENYVKVVVGDVYGENRVYTGFQATDVVNFSSIAPRDFPGLSIFVYDWENRQFDSYNKEDVLHGIYGKDVKFNLRRGLNDPNRLEFIPQTAIAGDLASLILDETRGVWVFNIDQTTPVLRKGGLNEALHRAIKTMGLIDPELEDRLKAAGVKKGFRFVLDPKLDVPEETFIDFEKGMAEIRLNPRMMEPGLENALLGAVIKGLVNVTTKADEGKIKPLKTYPLFFVHWVRVTSRQSIKAVLNTLGSGAVPLINLLDHMDTQSVTAKSWHLGGIAWADFAQTLCFEEGGEDEAIRLAKWLAKLPAQAEDLVKEMLGEIEKIAPGFTTIKDGFHKGEPRELMAVPLGSADTPIEEMSSPEVKSEGKRVKAALKRATYSSPEMQEKFNDIKDPEKVPLELRGTPDEQVFLARLHLEARLEDLKHQKSKLTGKEPGPPWGKLPKPPDTSVRKMSENKLLKELVHNTDLLRLLTEGKRIIDLPEAHAEDGYRPAGHKEVIDYPHDHERQELVQAFEARIDVLSEELLTREDPQKKIDEIKAQIKELGGEENRPIAAPDGVNQFHDEIVRLRKELAVLEKLLERKKGADHPKRLMPVPVLNASGQLQLAYVGASHAFPEERATEKDMLEAKLVLRRWGIYHSISHSRVNRLKSVLKRHISFITKASKPGHDQALLFNVYRILDADPNREEYVAVEEIVDKIFRRAEFRLDPTQSNDNPLRLPGVFNKGTIPQEYEILNEFAKACQSLKGEPADLAVRYSSIGFEIRPNALEEQAVFGAEDNSGRRAVTIILDPSLYAPGMEVRRMGALLEAANWLIRGPEAKQEELIANTWLELIHTVGMAAFLTAYKNIFEIYTEKIFQTMHFPSVVGSSHGAEQEWLAFVDDPESLVLEANLQALASLLVIKVRERFPEAMKEPNGRPGHFMPVPVLNNAALATAA